MPLHRSSRTNDLEEALKQAKFIVGALLPRISLANDLEQTLEQVKNGDLEQTLEQAKNDLEQAKIWFEEVIANSGENDTFYRQIAEARKNEIINRVK